VPEGGHSRCGTVIEVQPGEDPADVARDRELPLPDGLDQRVVGGALEPAVAQCDAAEVAGRPAYR
jgi:hypothetical protein